MRCCRNSSFADNRKNRQRLPKRPLPVRLSSVFLPPCLYTDFAPVLKHHPDIFPAVYRYGICQAVPVIFAEFRKRALRFLHQSGNNCHLCGLKRRSLIQPFRNFAVIFQYLFFFSKSVYDIVKTLENRYPIFKAGEAAGTSMCRVLSMKSTVRPFHGPWGAYAPQG